MCPHTINVAQDGHNRGRHTCMRPERVLAASSWTSSFLSLSSRTMSCCTALAFSGDSRNMWRNQNTCMRMPELKHAHDESADRIDRNCESLAGYDTANFSVDHMSVANDAD